MVGKKHFYFVAILLIGLFSLSFILASFNIGTPDYFIEDVYGPEFSIKGWVNISFDDEPLDSIFEDSFGNNITLGNALSKNPSYSYTCSPTDCENAYSASNAQSSKTLNLKTGEEKLLGLKFTGDVESVDSVSFDVSSDAGAACGESQLKIDILNDGEIEVINNKSLENVCENTKTYGCFDTEKETTEPILKSEPFCEKINLSSAPGVVVGAWIKNNSGSGAITAELFNSFGENKGECNLQTSSSTGEEVSCGIDYQIISEEEYFVCVYSNSQENNYRIQGYSTDPDHCGGYRGVGNPVSAEFRIFAKEKEFDSFGSRSVNNFLSDGTSLAVEIQNYLENRFGSSMNCGSEGCVVPIKIISNAPQSVTLNNLDLVYNEKNLGQIPENKFHDVTETSAEVTSSSGFQRVFLDNLGLTVPGEINTYDYTLSLSGQEVFSEKIEVKDAPIINSLNPVKTASSIPTKFKLKITSEINVSDYVWSFGDNSTNVTTLGNSTTHIYTSIGNYNLSVKVTNIEGLTSEKTFNVNVTLPIEFINTRLAELNSNLNSVRNSISDFETFHKQGIESVLNLDFTESELERLQKAYGDAENESDYVLIVSDLQKLDLPEAIIKSQEADNFVFFSKEDSIDLEVLKSIGGGTYDESRISDYKEAAVAWQQQNLITFISFDEFSQEKNDKIEPLLKFFTISVQEKTSIDYPYYLIIPKLANMEVSGAVKQTEEYYYKELFPNQEISFYTSENYDFINVPAFISPSINRLSVSGELIGEVEKESNLGWVILAFVILIVIALIIYVIMQEWYKRKYESKLFKDRNDLYNMVNYVNNAKEKGLSNDEIEENLKDAGWGGERIRYVMKKYAGKRTGMLEVPIDATIGLFSGKRKKEKVISGKKGKAPVFVKILSILYFINAAMSVLGAIIVIVSFRSFEQYFPAVSLGGYFLGGVLIALGILSLAIGWGLWKGKNWGRILLVILAVISVFGSLYFTITGGIVGLPSFIIILVLNGAIVGYLMFNKKSKEFFK